MKQKRDTRTYKTTKIVYTKAMRRAKKEKAKLATIIEDWVTCYGDGAEIAKTYTFYGEPQTVEIKKQSNKTKKP